MTDAPSGPPPAAPAAPAGEPPRRRAPGPVGPRFRTAVAFTMAAVAIASASVAFYSAHWASLAAEEDGVALQQQADQDRIEQGYNIEVAEDLRLFAVYEAHDRAAADIGMQAAALRAANPEEASLLDLEYQGHVAAMTALWPLFQAGRPTGGEGQKQYDAGSALQALETADAELPLLDPEAQHASAEDKSRTALSLVLLIVALIASLFVLTVAQVFTRFARVVAAIGIGLALGTAAEISRIDPAITQWLVLAGSVAAVLMILQLLAPRLPRRIGQWFPTEEEGTEAAEAAVHGAAGSRVIHEHGAPEPPIIGPDLAKDRLSRALAISIAGMTLATALVGFFQVNTAHQGENEAILAQQHALMALTSEVAGYTAAEAAVSAHSRRVEAEVALANAQRQQRYWQSAGDDRRAADLAVAVDALNREAVAATQAATTLIPKAMGPVDYAASSTVGDPAFPFRYRVTNLEEAFMHGALQDAANSSSATLTARARNFGFGVAVLAVVLYLLGLALVLRSRALRWTFIVAAIVLVGIAGTRVVPALLDTANQATLDANAQEAAEAYARGLVETAVAGPGDDLSRAIVDLQIAVNDRPEFASGYGALATASLLSGSPQRGSNISVEDEKTEARTIALLRQASVHGAESTTSQLDLGFLLYRRAIRSTPPDRAGLEESMAVTQAAIDKLASREDGNRLILTANLAVAALAAGRTDDARRAYDATVAVLTARGPATDDAANLWREDLVAGPLTDLDNLATAQPSLAGVVGDVKTYLVTRTWPGPAADATEVTNLKITDSYRSYLEWTANATSTAAFKDKRVVAEWYRRSPSGEWYVLPEVSGKAGNWVDVGVASGVSYDVFGRARMIASTSLGCHVDGEQDRLELYVGGRLAASAELTVASSSASPQEATAMVPIEEGQIGIAACLPSGWTRTAYEPGVVVSYEGPPVAGFRRGVIAWRFNESGPRPSPSSCPGKEPTLHALDAALSTGLLPKEVLASGDEGTGQGLGWRCIQYRWLDTPGEGPGGGDAPYGPQYGYLEGAPQDDGSVIVVAVFGPWSDFDDPGPNLGILLRDAILPVLN